MSKRASNSVGKENCSQDILYKSIFNLKKKIHNISFLNIKNIGLERWLSG